MKKKIIIPLVAVVVIAVVIGLLAHTGNVPGTVPSGEFEHEITLEEDDSHEYNGQVIETEPFEELENIDGPVIFTNNMGHDVYLAVNEVDTEIDDHVFLEEYLVEEGETLVRELESGSYVFEYRPADQEERNHLVEISWR